MRRNRQQSERCEQIRAAWRGGVLALAVVVGVAGTAAAQTYVEQTRFGNKPSPESDGLNAAVALDGDTAVLSTTEQLLDPARRPGAVFVYRRTAGSWALEQRLVDPNSRHNDDFGRLAIDVQGDTLVVGASAGCNTVLAPGFSIFQRIGTTWVLQRSYTATDGVQDQCLGMSVSLSGDTIAASAPNSSSSSIYVVRRVSGAWGEPERVLPPQTPPRSSFGAGLDVSGDTMCVVSRVTGQAYVDVMTRSGNNWTHQQGFAPPAATASFQDLKCSIDGDSLIVGIRSYSTSGSPTGQNVGVAHIYTRSAGAWTLQQTLPGPGTGGALFGQSVSLRGNEAVVASSGQQVAHVYRRTGTTWALAQSIAKVTAHPSSIPVAVGVSLSASGLMVGQGSHSHGVYVLGTGPAVPGAPPSFTATATGNTVNMAWGVPTGGPIANYTLIARTAPGAAPVATLPLGNVTSFGVTGPNGTFILSVRARNAQGEGPESNPVTVTLPGGMVAPPAAPIGLAGAVSGTTASFTWAAPSSGGTPAGYRLLAGLTPGFTAPIASLSVPASPLSFSVSGVPVGTYYVRLLSTNAAGTSGPSNEVQVTVAGAPPPGAPVLNTPTVSGSTVALSWTAGAGGPPAGYTLIATTPGGALIAAVPLSGTSVAFSGVPSGTYAVRVTASNAAGTSAPSNQVTVTVP